MRGAIIAGFVLATIAAAAAALPSEGSKKVSPRSPEVSSNEIDDDFPTFENESATETPFTMRILSSLGSLLSGLTQLPNLMARAFNFFVTTQPFARLREEARNLNISYPKTGLLF